MNICMISNGHGEDSIGKALLDSITSQHKNCHCTVFPLVGKGHAYTLNGYSSPITNPSFPSGGFIRSIRDAAKDIQAGLIRHTLYQRKAIRAAVNQSDVIIAVGDIFCLWMSAQAKTPVYFLPTAKSDTFMPHSKTEAWLMKRWCKAVFPRDQITTNALKKMGVPAVFEGNIMMDNLVTNDLISGLEVSTKPIVGILPGSRDEAYINLAHICKIIDQLGSEFSYAIARSEALDEAKIQSIIGDRPIVMTTHFKAVINRASIIIGLSGTGNEQAAYLGKKVICFTGFGPQTTAQRFHEQQKLMGNNIIFVPNNSPKAIASALQSQFPNAIHHTEDFGQAADRIAKKITSTLSC